MVSSALTGLKGDELLFLCFTAATAVGFSLAVLLGAFWSRREQRLRQRNVLGALSRRGRDSDEMILVGRDIMACGELVAQFRVSKGKHVLSVLEADGKRFIHVDGELSSQERTKMVRYLKSEGFMS